MNLKLINYTGKLNIFFFPKLNNGCHSFDFERRAKYYVSNRLEKIGQTKSCAKNRCYHLKKKFYCACLHRKC